MKVERVSVNGRIQPVLSEEDSNSANGAYESFRFHDGRVFLLDEHFDRLEKSLKALGISWDDDRKKYRSWIADLCQDLPKGKDAFVRFIVTSSGSDVKTSIHVAYIPFFSLKSYKAVVLDKTKLIKPGYFAKTGFRIKSVEYIKDVVNNSKSSGLEDNTEGILLTPEGYVAEGLTSNIFWTKGGRLFTPPLNIGVLAGTLRAYLLKKHEVREVLAKAETLEQADEIILTSGASYLRPLSQINGIEKPGINGAVFKKFYQELTEDINRTSESL